MLDKNNNISIMRSNVYKDIKRIYDVSHVPIIQNALHEKGLKCPEIIDYTIRNKNQLSYCYCYVEGKNKSCIDENEYFCTLKAISGFIDKCNIQSLCDLSFYDKVDIFLRNINVDKLKLRERTMIATLSSIYGNIKRKYDCTHLIHGDLDFSNLVWNENKYNIIDFDECCLGPKGMDCAIGLARILKKSNGSKENIQLEMRKLADRYEIDVNLVKLYIVKVIVEKLYLGQENIISFTDAEQKTDSADAWYKVLRNI